jgi:integrase
MHSLDGDPGPSQGELTSMSRTKPTPRRTRVPGDDNHHIYVDKNGVYEIGARDHLGVLRWYRPDGGISAVRKERDRILGKRADGETAKKVDKKLRFGPVAEDYLAGPVASLEKPTQDKHRINVNLHLKLFARNPLDLIEADAIAKLVRDMRSRGYAEWTIHGVLTTLSQVFKYAKRRKGWRGENPVLLLSPGERAKVGDTPEPRVYEDDELQQLLAAAKEPWRTLFRLTGVLAGRQSEQLGLWWENFDLDDINNASIHFDFQYSRTGVRKKLKTEDSKARLPIPRSIALLMLAHKRRSRFNGPRDYVFCTRDGKPLMHRNVLRTLYTVQERARKPDGTPTFPELFECDDRRNLRVDDRGKYVPNKKRRRDLPALPDFHALRHAAAMACEDSEEAKDLLRHKNTTTTDKVYRNHFNNRRREALRSRLEAREQAVGGTHVETQMETTGGIRPHKASEEGEANPLKGAA